MPQQLWDDELHRWRKPLAFADDDYEDEDDEDDFFTEDGLVESDDDDGDSGAATSGDADESGDLRRPVAAYVVFTVCGLATPLLTIAAMRTMGPLAWPPFLMLFFSGLGALAAIANLVYNLTKGKRYAVGFHLRSFFRWHELAAIALLLVPLALTNLAAIPEGNQFTLRRGEPGYSLIATLKALPHAITGNFEKGAPLLPVPPEATSGLFLGGALWGALGYAMALGLAGLLFAAFRPFNTPFSTKIEERVNEDTGETEQLVTEPSTAIKIANIPFRLLVGYNAGATVGLLLGISVAGLNYLLFLRHENLDPALQGLLTAVGSSPHPDLAFAGGFSLAGLIVPLAFLVVGKLSPPGKSVTEGEVKARFASAGGAKSGLPVELPAPAMVSFGDIGPDPDEDLLADIDLDASLTEELLNEFGDDLHAVFGLDTASKTEAERQHVQETMDRSQVATIVEQSFGELGQIQVEVAAELGRASISLSDWLHLQEGCLIELNQPVGDTIDLLFNGVLKGRGQLAVVDNHIGVTVSTLNLHGPLEEEARVEGRT